MTNVRFCSPAVFSFWFLFTNRDALYVAEQIVCRCLNILRAFWIVIKYILDTCQRIPYRLPHTYAPEARQPIAVNPLETMKSELQNTQYGSLCR